MQGSSRRKWRLGLAVVVLAAIAVGCGTTARHHEEELFGEVAAGTGSEALASYDRMMGMSDDEAAAYVSGKEKAALELGKRLFMDPNLGTTGQSCNGCHPSGRTIGTDVGIGERMGLGPFSLTVPTLIGAAASYPTYKAINDEVVTIEMMNNTCIRMFMSGKKLPLDSPEAFYLAKYVTAFSEGHDGR